jgi:hypothetical protein
MMKTLIKAALLMTALAAILAFFSPAVSTTPADIEVTNGDAVRWETVTESNVLSTTLGTVAVRTVVEFVDTYSQRAMSGPGLGLQARLQEVVARPFIGAAQAANSYALAAPASGLSAALANAAQRIEIHLAERSRDHTLVFPGALLQDKVPPEIGRPSTSGARLKWTTNEFTTSVVRYGPSEEDLSKTTVDGELRRDHTMALDGMGPGITLFCQITNTDQSGNAATSAIYQVSGTQYVFMPSLSR